MADDLSSPQTGSGTGASGTGWEVPEESAAAEKPPVTPSPVTPAVNNVSISHPVAPAPTPISTPTPPTPPAPVRPPVSTPIVAPVIPPKPMTPVAPVVPPTTPMPPTPKPESAPKKGGGLAKFVLAILVIVLLLVGVGIGLVYADDKGILETGLASKLSFLPLSSVWGGLSANPSTVAAQIASAWQQKNGVVLTGSFTGSGTSSNTSVVPSSSTSTTTTPATADTAASTAIDPFAQSGTFNFSSYRSNYSLLFDANDSGITIHTEYRIVDGQAFGNQDVNIPGTTPTSTSGSGSATTASTPVWLQLGTAPAISVTSLQTQLGSVLSSASFVGAEKIGSTRTYHFRTTVHGSDISAINSLASLSAWKTSNGPLDVWVDRDSHLPVKLTLGLTRTSDSQKVLFNASVSATATTPILAPENAIDPNAAVDPDAERKADLTSISKALEKYFTAVGSYPVSAAITHLDQTDSVVYKALVPVYLDKMPTDPNTAHYYGYVSDGTTYQLSAVLSNQNDPQGTKSGPVTLFVVKNASH